MLFWKISGGKWALNGREEAKRQFDRVISKQGRGDECQDGWRLVKGALLLTSFLMIKPQNRPDNFEIRLENIKNDFT